MDDSPIGRVGCGSRSRPRKIGRLRRIVAAARTVAASRPRHPRDRLRCPCPRPPSRATRLHSRRVTYEGYQRDDGLFDIEGHLVDTKDHDFDAADRRAPGGRAGPRHVGARHHRPPASRSSTIEAQTDRMPYPGALRPHRPRLSRSSSAPTSLQGFRKRLHDAMGGVHGCTHLTEHARLPADGRGADVRGPAAREDAGADKPFQLDRCHALETTTETVRRYYPQWYRGAA